MMKSRLPLLEQRHERSDALVFPAIPGSKFRNHTTLRIRGKCSRMQFPFGVLDVAISLLTHPKLLSDVNHAGLICARDVYLEEINGATVARVPIFIFE